MASKSLTAQTTRAMPEDLETKKAAARQRIFAPTLAKRSRRYESVSRYDRRPTQTILLSSRNTAASHGFACLLLAALGKVEGTGCTL